VVAHSLVGDHKERPHRGGRLVAAELVDREPNSAYTRLIPHRHDLARRIEPLDVAD